jgi:asparagine synthase (glutamine-hydrolysing)
MDAQYAKNDFDRKLFPGYPSIHELPVRVKLRINDITTWMNTAVDDNLVTPNDVLCPPTELPSDP